MQPADEVITARLGTQIAGRWTLVRLLGVGGMAAVYAARDATGQEVALKLLHPEMSRRQGVRERFLREGTVANQISHTGAVRVLEYGTEAGGEQTFLVMELLRGEALNERFRRAGKLPLAEVFRYLDEVLDVLALAHDKGIIHRDLKPDNLFLTESGQIKVLDFGLARMLESTPGDFTTKTGVALGTLPYMAPEQALGKRAEIDGRVDLFALGASAFRMLSGRKVHEAESEAELLMAMATKPAPALASIAPELGRPACAVIDLSLAFSRDARYRDARAMQRDVRAVLAGKPPPLATERAASREQATAVNLPAIVLPPPSARGPTPPPSSVDPTRPDPTLPDPTVPDRIAPSLRAPQAEAMPPSSQLTSMTLDLGPKSSVAPLSGGAVASGASITGPAAATPRRTLPLWAVAAIGIAALALLGLAAVFAFSALEPELPLPLPNADDSALPPNSAHEPNDGVPTGNSTATRPSTTTATSRRTAPAEPTATPMLVPTGATPTTAPAPHAKPGKSESHKRK